MFSQSTSLWRADEVAEHLVLNTQFDLSLANELKATEITTDNNAIYLRNAVITFFLMVIRRAEKDRKWHNVRGKMLRAKKDDQ